MKQNKFKRIAPNSLTNNNDDTERYSSSIIEFINQVEGSEVTPERYGVYTLINNILIAVNATENLEELNDPLPLSYVAKQLNRQMYMLIYLKMGLYDQDNDWSKNDAKLRLFAAYGIASDAHYYSRISDIYYQSLVNEEIEEESYKEYQDMSDSYRNLAIELGVESEFDQIISLTGDSLVLPSFFKVCDDEYESFDDFLLKTTEEMGALNYHRVAQISQAKNSTLRIEKEFCYGGSKGLSESNNWFLGTIGENLQIIYQNIGGLVAHYWPEHIPVEA